MEWNYIEYVRNFYKIERIVKSNWDKKEGKNKVSISVTVKLRLRFMFSVKFYTKILIKNYENSHQEKENHLSN